MLLQFLICIVDAELFETIEINDVSVFQKNIVDCRFKIKLQWRLPVGLEALETIDVQHTNKTFRTSILPNGTIDFVNKPEK